MIMPANILVKRGRKYCGKYIATKSFEDTNIISSGIDPVKVVKEAKKKGANDPVLIYIPEKGMTHIY
jgi:hypothetical protein